MSKKVEQFPFYINYADVDLYCFRMMDAYGYNEEDSKFIKLVDSHWDGNSKWDNKNCNADELLLLLRQCLVDSGFEKEVEEMDKTFAGERKGRGAKNPYIPMHKRWEIDDCARKNIIE